MKNKGLLVFGLAVAAIVIVALIFGGIYNSLVQAEEKVSESWAQVENVYQRRLDLTPNLVEAVKGYAAHEKGTLDAVIEARSKATQVNISPKAFNSPEALTQFEQIQQGLSSALSRLLVVIEQYPDLKANQNFLALQSQLEGTENRIAVERRRFNEVARDFNTQLRSFPNNVVARWMGLKRKSYFAADEGARVAPKIKF